MSKILRSYVLPIFAGCFDICQLFWASLPLFVDFSSVFALLTENYHIVFEQVFDRGYFLCQLVSFHFNNDICCYIELLSVPFIFSCVCEVFYLILFFPWLFSNFIFSFITLYFWFRPLQKCGLRPFVTACMAFPWGPLLCKVTIIISR